MAAFKSLLRQPANNTCVDCGESGCKWTSLNNGVFICASCAEVHRELGVQLSFVKSINNDGWSQHRLKFLQIGGNERFLSIVSKYKIQSESLASKYSSPVINWYRSLLKAEIDGCTPPQAPPVPEDLTIQEFTRNFIVDNNTPTRSPEKRKTWLDNIRDTANNAGEIARRSIRNTAKTVITIKETANSVLLQSVNMGSNFYDNAREIGSNVVDKSIDVGSSIIDASNEFTANLFSRAKTSISAPEIKLEEEKSRRK